MAAPRDPVSLLDAPPHALPEIAFPDLFSDLTDAVVLAGPDRRIIWTNPAATTIFGYAAEELTGRETRMLYAEDAAFREQGQVRFNPHSDAASCRYEISYRRKNGEVFPSQTTASPVRSASGELQGYLAIIKDVSEQHAVDSLMRQLYAVTASHDLSSSAKIRKILQLGCDRFQTSTAVVSWIEGDTYTVLLSESDLHEIEPGTEFRLGETYCFHTLNADGPLAFHRAGKSPIAAHPCYSLFRLETYIGVPLIVDGRRFGTLNFTCAEDRHPFTAPDLELIRFFAAWVSLELSVQNTIDRLISAASTDPLTGGLNRKAWFDRAAEAARQGDSPHSLILFDIDRFKEVNDTHGHPAGDAVLRQISTLLAEQCRDGDLLGRIGGEEFALFLPETGQALAVQIAGRIRSAVEAAELASCAGPLHLTVSAGAALCPPGADLDLVYERADQALYKAKGRGRNTVASV
jgi:diguanylate cyclase (GGDEF)-like protein/PAS domain S-box-containing protein